MNTVSKTHLMEVLDLLDGLGLRYWVDGGWGVDLLVGRQNRPHRDLDIDFDGTQNDMLMEALVAAGYVVTTDWSPIRVELHHPRLGYLDVHPLVIAPDRSAKQADLTGGWYCFEAEWFTSAVFEGRQIPCLSPEAQTVFHTGYAPREVDRLDMAHLEAFLRGEG